jgi:hypothetical protein
MDLIKHCILENCHETEQTSYLFSFPIENPETLHEWITQIPYLDLSQVDLKNSYLCENHFDTEQIKIKSDKELLPNSVPIHFPEAGGDQLKPDPMACRFCLKQFESGKSSIFIDGMIRKHFKNLTNSEVSYVIFEASPGKLIDF